MRGKLTLKTPTAPITTGQEMYGTQDSANGNIVQCPSAGLQSASVGSSQNNGASSNDDDWGPPTATDPWAYDGGDCIDSTNQMNGDDSHDDTCRHCRGGHMSSECPTRSDRGPPSRNSFKYNQPGSMANERTSEGGDYRGDRRPRDNECYRCGEKGHISRQCPGNRSSENDRSRGGDRSFRSESQPGRCPICEGKGHTEEQCPSPRPSGDSGYGSRASQGSSSQQEREATCYRCGETGHNSYSCPKRVGADTDKDAPSGPYDHVVTVSEEQAVNRNNTGVNFDRYNNIHVKVTDSRGGEVLEWENKKLNSFEEGNLHKGLKAMIAMMNYKVPTPVQKYAIPMISQGWDLMACAQTGSGKTAAFALPIINSIIESNLTAPPGRNQTPYALILTPTRELADQITSDAQQYCLGTGIRIKECYGGTVLATQARNIETGSHVIVGTTGRIQDFLNRDIFNLSKLRYFVLDEADRMLDMGFSSAVRYILDHHSRNRQNPIQTVMFSATFPKEVQELARRHLRPNFLKLDVGVVGTVNSDVTQFLEEHSGMSSKRERLYEIIAEEIKENPQTKILVFTEKKKTTDAMASFLSEMGIKATSMHGDRFQEQRAKALSDFQKNDCPVLVATSVAARGLDFSGVRHVINFDLPKEIDEYVHRVGRTGRNGNLGRATSFYEPSKDYNLKDALVRSFLDGGQKPPSFL